MPTFQPYHKHLLINYYLISLVINHQLDNSVAISESAFIYIAYRSAVSGDHGDLLILCESIFISVQPCWETRRLLQLNKIICLNIFRTQWIFLQGMQLCIDHYRAPISFSYKNNGGFNFIEVRDTSCSLAILKRYQNRK